MVKQISGLGVQTPVWSAAPQAALTSNEQYSLALQLEPSRPPQVLPPEAPPLPLGLPAEPPLPVGLPPEPAPALAPGSPPEAPAVHVVSSGQSSPITTELQPLGAMASGASKSTGKSAAQGRFLV